DALGDAIKGGLANGPIASYPMVDIRVKVKKLQFNPEYPSTFAVSAATMKALSDAISNAEPIILEPVMSMEIVIPMEYLGDVINDINQRRATIKRIETRSGFQIIHALVPLSETFGYSTSLRS
ncbi:MAG: elongation factor G, partial [bacterium]